MDVPSFFQALWQNRILWSAFFAWFGAQFVKMLLYGFINRDFRLERLWGSGGMPSSHAATVCALATAACCRYGPASFEFAICFFFAAVVLHDARGVRFETGKQAEVINTIYGILKDLSDAHIPEVEKLKVLVGHTPLQVLVGAAMGVVTGLLLH